MIGAVVWLVWRAVRGRAAPGGGAGDPSAGEIVKRRYARGEIDRSSYERMLEDVEHDPA